MRGRNSSADSGPGLWGRRKSAPDPAVLAKALNPGGLEAAPPFQRSLPILFKPPRSQREVAGFLVA